MGFPIGGQWWHVMSLVTWPLDSAYVVSYWWSIVTMRLSCTVMEIWSLKHFGATALTLWGHVTSSVTWPFDSPCGDSDKWSMVTMRLSWTVSVLYRLKDIGITTLTFGVTWRHRSRDHSTPHMRFPIGGQWWPCVYLAQLVGYTASKILGSRPSPFGVTWCNQSRDY